MCVSLHGYAETSVLGTVDLSVLSKHSPRRDSDTYGGGGGGGTSVTVHGIGGGGYKHSVRATYRQSL